MSSAAVHWLCINLYSDHVEIYAITRFSGYFKNAQIIEIEWYSLPYMTAHDQAGKGDKCARARNAGTAQRKE